MCRLLHVSTSSYYAWRSRPESERARQNHELVTQIEAVHQESNQTYGSPRIHQCLNSQGTRCSENRVARLMRQNGIRAVSTKPFTVTTDSKHALPVAENLLDRQFEPEAANTVWAADITYIWTQQGWLYLAVVIDLFSRQVVGFSMEKTMARGLVIEALEMALGRREVGIGLVHHSDRGSQYASGDFQDLVASSGMLSSMSRRGNCWDNAPVESFFATLKRERVHRQQYVSRSEARSDIFAYIETWYNRKRLHSSLGYLSPVDYERQAAQQPIPIAA